MSGDNTVMSFCRHENNAKNNFIQIDVDDKRLFCDVSVGKWLPTATANHLKKLSKTIAEKPVVLQARTEGSPNSSVKKSRNGRNK